MNCPRIPYPELSIPSRVEVFEELLGNTVIVNGFMITPELAKRWDEYLKNQTK